MKAARFLLDTDICIYIQRQKPLQVLARLEALEPGEAVVSVITWGELMYGAGKSSQTSRVLKVLDEFGAIIPVLPMLEHAGRNYGQLCANLESLGQPIGNNDLWIAAHALTAGLTLVTNNEREFRRVPGLLIENWSA